MGLKGFDQPPRERLGLLGTTDWHVSHPSHSLQLKNHQTAVGSLRLAGDREQASIKQLSR